MSTTLTVRLSRKEAKALDEICKLTGKSRSELVRESLRDLRLREALRERMAERAAPGRIREIR